MTDTCTYGNLTKGVPSCHADATHTSGSHFIGPVCEKHALDGCEPLGEYNE